MSVKTFFDDDGENPQIYTGDSIEIYDTGECVDTKVFTNSWIKTEDGLPTECGLYLTTRLIGSEPTLSIVWFAAADKEFVETFRWTETHDGVEFEVKLIEKVVTNEILAWMRWPTLYTEEKGDDRHDGM